MKVFLDFLGFRWYVVCMIKINDIIRDPILGASSRVVKVTATKAIAVSKATGSQYAFPLHRLVKVGTHPLFTLWVRD